jgi:competence ComEA-like helix-hairpin-helix protein
MSATPDRDDWTAGPAKWAAVFVLAGVSVTGLVASLRHGPPPTASVSRNQPIQQHDPGAPDDRPGASLPARGIIVNGPPSAGEAKKAPALALKINLNTATAVELELLPRIGPALAKRIVDYRAARGPFRHLDDLDAIPGIGERTLDLLRPHVTVE